MTVNFVWHDIPSREKIRKGTSLSRCPLMNTTSLTFCGSDHLPTEKLKKCTCMNRCSFSQTILTELQPEWKQRPLGRDLGTVAQTRCLRTWRNGRWVLRSSMSPHLLRSVFSGLPRFLSRVSMIISNSLFLLGLTCDSFKRHF